MWETLGQALCLVLVIEGMIPFLYPTRWRNLVLQLAQTSDRQLRTMGFVAMAIGVGLLYILK